VRELWPGWESRGGLTEATGEVWPAGMLVAPSTALTHISSRRTSLSQSARRLGLTSMLSTGNPIGDRHSSSDALLRRYAYGLRALPQVR
jgi:hypothetical protein